MSGLEVIVRGEAEEFAALVVAIQERQVSKVHMNTNCLVQVMKDSIAFSAPIVLRLRQGEEQ